MIFHKDEEAWHRGKDSLFKNNAWVIGHHPQGGKKNLDPHTLYKK